MDEQKLEMLRRLAALGGMSREDVDKKIAEAEEKARRLQELAAAEDEARSHRPLTNRLNLVALFLFATLRKSALTCPMKQAFSCSTRHS